MSYLDMTPRQNRAFTLLNRGYHQATFIPTKARRRLYGWIAFLIRGRTP